VTRTGTGSGAGTGTGTGSVRRSLPASESFQAPEEVSLKPRPKWKGATAAALVLAAGGFFVWKGVLKKKSEDDGARLAQIDPSKRFHVYVKSDPPGADIFIEGEAMPIGETPVTLPIDLTIKNSIKLILRKDGYEDFEARVINEMPLAINLKRREPPPEAVKPAEPAPPSAPPEPSEEPKNAATDAPDKAGHGHHHSGSAKRPHKTSAPSPAPTPPTPTPTPEGDE
jgi:PEGA domain-containing protein